MYGAYTSNVTYIFFHAKPVVLFLLQKYHLGDTILFESNSSIANERYFTGYHEYDDAPTYSFLASVATASDQTAPFDCIALERKSAPPGPDYMEYVKVSCSVPAFFVCQKGQ